MAHMWHLACSPEPRAPDARSLRSCRGLARLTLPWREPDGARKVGWTVLEETPSHRSLGTAGPGRGHGGRASSSQDSEKEKHPH